VNNDGLRKPKSTLASHGTAVSLTECVVAIFLGNLEQREFWGTCERASRSKH
jgi:hypothetical protein